MRGGGFPFTMQRYLEGWTGPPPQQRATQPQASFVRAGHVNLNSSSQNVTQPQSRAQQIALETMTRQAQAQLRSQQITLENMTRGQTGARRSPHMVNKSVSQQLSPIIPVPVPPLQVLQGHTASVMTDVAGDMPQTGLNGLANTYHELPMNGRDMAVLNSSLPPGQMVPTEMVSQESPHHMTRSQSQLSTDLASQQHSQGPVIGHGPQGPVYLNRSTAAGSPRRRRSQVTAREDTTSTSEDQEYIPSQTQTTPRSTKKRGRPTNAERQARRQTRQRGDSPYLPR